ncbi:cation tolerance protein CutA [Vibrio sp. 10N.286.49.C2]|nr:cation tolerance protein CutA [Vibrio sp. 10N.286.49.C2]PMH57168.1 cation tolerance protein CutA [Vibrio sp. 10N.286.49.B1]PMH83019.1 cation tolerance protein CutA [Vibrio sp. 10N.286.48.B7]
MAVTQTHNPKNRPQAPQRTTQTLNSTDALAMIEHGSDVTLTITTPVGTSFRCSSQFIGAHSDHRILLELPQISESELKDFYQEGFWLVVRAISQRGEGGIIQFRSQLLHLMEEPVPLLVLSIPQSMTVTNLRKEARYEVNLDAVLEFGDRRVRCEIRDMSKSGCRFILPALSKHLTIGEPVTLRVQSDAMKGRAFPPISGPICNVQKSNHYNGYGIRFDEFGEANAKELLSLLKFDGTKFKLRA